MEIMRTQRGRMKVFYKGYMFTKYKEYKNHIRFVCESRHSERCPGALLTNLEVTGNPIKHSQHTHPPDNNKFLASKLRQEMKELAQNSAEKPGQIFAAVISKANPEILLDIPSENSCKRAMRYLRAKDRSAVSTNTRRRPSSGKTENCISATTEEPRITNDDLDEGEEVSNDLRESSGIRATIIHPATEKHVQKYTYQPVFMVNETPEVYKNTVLPYLESQQFSNQWVYNILEHKSEEDRIIFEDPNPDTGFILIPDMKWDETQKDNPYVIAICHARGLKSLRDLTADHIPLLKNIKEKSSEAILKKFNRPLSRFRVYFHYQPSYYHLHVHFSTFESDAPGTQAERAHLLDTVISNLELMSDYYKRATLTYAVKKSDPLFETLKESGII